MKNSAIEKRLAKAEQAINAMKEVLPREEGERQRIRFTQPGDRVLMLRYLYEVAQKRIDPELWARLNPKEYARLLEIAPLKKVDG